MKREQKSLSFHQTKTILNQKQLRTITVLLKKLLYLLLLIIMYIFAGSINL